VTALAPNRDHQQGMPRIAFLTLGSRGDIQPLIALAVKLQSCGYEILATTSSENVDFFAKFGLKAIAVWPDLENFFQTDEKMKKAMTSGNAMAMMDGQAGYTSKNRPDAIKKQWEILKEYKPELIISGTDELASAAAFSQILKVPLVNAGLQIIGVTSQNKSMFNEAFWHRVGWVMLFTMFWSSMKTDNKMYKTLLHDELRGEVVMGDTSLPHFIREWHTPIAPIIIGVSSHICPTPSDFPPAFSKQCVVSGFWVIDQETQTALSQKKDAHFGGDAIEQLEQFIAATADPPVYLGWGSMIAISPEHMAALAVRALKQSGMRGIILGGFAQLQPSHLEAAADAAELGAYAREHVLFVKTAPHEWLFPKCKIVVHHGGAGTTAAGWRAGVPSVITPCFADQFDNAALMQSSGAGIGLAQFKKLSAKDLAGALQKCAAAAHTVHGDSLLRTCTLLTDGAALRVPQVR
jgi:sterol 3beta-glucosyltransferase